MNQERQRRFVGPVKVFDDVTVADGFEPRARAPLKGSGKDSGASAPAAVPAVRNIGKNSPKARSDLGQLGRVVPHLPTEIIEARRLRQTAFDDLDERADRETVRLFRSSARPGIESPLRDAYSAISIARRRLAHAGSAAEHHQRAVAAERAIDRRANRATFGLPPHKSGSFRERERRNLQHHRRGPRTLDTRGREIATRSWLAIWLDSRSSRRIPTQSENRDQAGRSRRCRS